MSDIIEIFRPLERHGLQAKSRPNIFITTMEQGLLIYKHHPEIAQMISHDQDQWGIAKKITRQKDEKWKYEKNNSSLVGLPSLAETINMETAEKTPFIENTNSDMILKVGRTRVSPMVVYFFFLVRGFLGNIKSEKNAIFIAESKYIESFLHSQGIDKLYGLSTILEHLNLLSENTLRAFHKITITEALKSGVDPLEKLYFDSTRIAANSSWPTESNTIQALTSRIFHGFSILKENEIKVNFPKGTEDRIAETLRAATSIALIAGKKDSKEIMKKLYRSIIKMSKTLQNDFTQAVNRAIEKIGDVLPSLREKLENLCEYIKVDLHNLELCVTNAKKRVLENKIVPAEEKVLSISDDDAEMISKGTKETIFGYKPQIGRSEKGFIVSVLIPHGAAADSAQMKPITDAAIANTTVHPKVLSYDDGYTNKQERENYLAQNIEIVSFSGSKGKKLTEDTWDDDAYIEARNERSMVESTMSVLKGYFDLSRFTRRGIEAVTQELLTACIFLNIRLLVKLTA